MAKPRILHIYKDYYPPIVGGIEKTINLMAEGLRDEFDVRVLVANRKGKNVVEFINGVQVFKAACRYRIASAPLSPGFVSYLKMNPADILHFHCPNPTGDLAWLWAKPTGKVVVTWHSDIVRQRWAMGVYGPFLRNFLAHADVVMPTSPNYIESSPWLQAVREKCRVVPLGIPLDRFEETAEIRRRSKEIREELGGGPIIIFVGKFRYYKGLQFLVPAMKKINARLVLVGEGPMREKLDTIIRVLKLEDRVHFAGEVSDEELPAWYRAADIFCMPSHLRSEAFGISQIEAMACGLPVVSCNIPTGVPFVNHDGETGVIVEPGDWRALADGINKLLLDGGLLSACGAAAIRRAQEEFSIETMLSKVRNVYNGCLKS